MSNEPHLGTAAFYPYANRPIWGSHHGYPAGHAIRSLICTEEEFTAVCRFLADRRAAGGGSKLSEPAPTVQSYEDLED